MLTKILEYKIVHGFNLAILQLRAIVGMGHSKVFTTGQAWFNPAQYVIKYVGGR